MQCHKESMTGLHKKNIVIYNTFCSSITPSLTSSSNIQRRLKSLLFPQPQWSNCCQGELITFIFPYLIFLIPQLHLRCFSISSTKLLNIWLHLVEPKVEQRLLLSDSIFKVRLNQKPGHRTTSAVFSDTPHRSGGSTIFQWSQSQKSWFYP